MDSESSIWCTCCNCFRACSDFNANKRGNRKKTCYRHEKKRNLSFDEWDSFITEIRIWNHPNQDRVLDIKYIFSLDQLPISFGAKLGNTESHTSDRGPLSESMKFLLDITWKAGGFRFWHKRTRQDPGLMYEHYCFPDSSQEASSASIGKRDAGRMDRFSCESKPRLRPCLEDRTLSLTLHYSYYTPYVDIHVSPAALEFINGRIPTQTPSEIYRDLLASNLAGIGHVTEHQIYYQWQQANASIWRRDPDPFRSAELLLADLAGQYIHATYVAGKMRGLEIYVQGFLTALATAAKELAMDATFGTNNAGMDLFAVLAELDGAGVPLAYFFVETLAPEDDIKHADAGACTQPLGIFLRPLKSSGFNPVFFRCDKDMSEIAAIQQV